MIKCGDVVILQSSLPYYKEMHPNRIAGVVADLVNWGLSPSARRQQNKIAIIHWQDGTCSIEWPAFLHVRTSKTKEDTV
jgi:hypothetical protein